MDSANCIEEEKRALLEVENLLMIFYQSNVSNSEKRKIEAQLNHLRDTTFNWQYCLDNMSTFNNQYIWFFGSSTVEAVLLKWYSLSDDDKYRLRHGLVNLLFGYTAETPAVQRDKVAQILSLVASFQFPNDYPEYFEHILQLMKNQFPIGLALATALGDSVTQEKYVLSYEQRQRFLSAVTEHIPRLLNDMAPFFTHYMVSVAAPEDRQHPSKKNATAHLEQHTVDLLEMLQQYCTWIDLSIIDPKLTEALLHLCLIRPGRGETEVPVTALLVLSEFYHHKLPLASGITKQMMMGVQMLMRQPDLERADELYHERLTELVRLCTIRELIASRPFEWDEYFETMYNFTMQPRNVLMFLDRISTWRSVFELYNETLRGSASPDLKRLLGQMLPMQLAMGTMERMFYQNNHQRPLDILAEEDAAMVASDLQRFYNSCIRMVEVVTEITPQPMHDTVLATLATNEASPYRQVMRILKTVARTADESELAQLMAQTGEDQLRTFMRDFIPAGQIVARLCQALYDKVPSISNAVRWIMQDQLEMIDMMSQSTQPVERLFQRLTPRLSKEMINAAAQLLSTFHALLQLVQRPGTPAGGESPGLSEEQLLTLCAQLIRFLQPITHIRQYAWLPLANAAAKMLLHIAAAPLVSLPRMYLLLHTEFAMLPLTHLDNETAETVRRTITYCLLSPWHGALADGQTDEQRAAAAAGATGDGQLTLRQQQLSQYVRFLSRQLHAMNLPDWTTLPTDEKCHIVDTVNKEVKHLTELLTGFQALASGPKIMLARAFRDAVDQVMCIYDMTEGRGLALFSDTLVPHVLSHDTLLGLCHVAVELLQVQLGEQYLQQVVQLLLQRVRAETIAKRPLRSLSAVLEIFVLIVQQPGNRSLIADIVRLCIDDVLPGIMGETEHSYGSASDDVQPESAFLKLLHKLLVYRWHYFVPSQLLSQPHAQSPAANQHQYLSILQAYGQVITFWNDSNHVRQVLESLVELNSRYNLFNEPRFVTRCLTPFLYAMLSLAVRHHGALYAELLNELLYELARVSPSRFSDITSTLSPTLSPELRDRLSQCTDLPTFTQRMKQFITMTHIAERSFGGLGAGASVDHQDAQ